MDMAEYKICNRCVMDTSDCEITFDEKGNCNHCNNYLSRIVGMAYQGEKSDKEFDALVETMKRKGRNSKYDCEGKGNSASAAKGFVFGHFFDNMLVILFIGL